MLNLDKFNKLDIECKSFIIDEIADDWIDINLIQPNENEEGNLNQSIIQTILYFKRIFQLFTLNYDDNNQLRQFVKDHLKVAHH